MISIVVSWRNRQELAVALPMLVASARLLSGDLTIVNFGGSKEMLCEQITRFASEVHVIQVDNQVYFNKACAQNLGAGYSVQPLLFFCDCDIVLTPDSIESLAGQIQNRQSTFATLAAVKESDTNSRGGKHVVCFGYELRIRTADGRQLCIVDNEEDASDGSRQAPGLLMVRRTDFEKINGYNSNLHGWGWEDQDMISRLILGLGLERAMCGSAIHISHDDNARVAHYPIADRWESRDKMFRQALANYDNSNFSGTYLEDMNQTQAQKSAGINYC